MMRRGTAAILLLPVALASPALARSLGAADQSAREDRAIERVLSYTSYIARGSARHRELALTFDDGPGPYTAKLLSILRREHAPATFFQLGSSIDAFPRLAAAELKDGFAIGDHTQHHPHLAQLSKRAQAREILEAARRMRAYGAPFPRLFRPPFGSFNSESLSLLRRLRMLMVLWSVDTRDFSQPGVDRIVRRAVEGARPGAIVLMHDGGGNRSETLAALPRMIALLRERGYRLVTVPRLVLDDPPRRQQPPPHGLASR